MLGRILVFIGALLVLLLFSALVIPYFVDWGSFRKEFEVQASRALGKKVEVVGEVDVRVLPFPSITMHDVRVGRDASGMPLATADAFSMDAELAPFLSGEVRIFKMLLDHPVLNLTLDENGAMSWTATGNAPLSARRVVFEDVEVRDGEIRLADDGSGRVRTLSDINAMLSANAIEGPWRMEGSAVLDGHPGAFTILTGRPDAETGTMRLRLSADPEEWPVSAALEGDVTLTDGRPAYAGGFRLSVIDDDADADDIPPPRASGQFELTNESIAVSEYRLEIGTQVDPYVISGEANFDTRPGGTFLLTANGQQFNVERLSDYDTNLKKDRVATPSARERLDTLIGFLRQVPVPQLPGTVTFRLPALVSGDTTIRSIVLDAAPDGDGWTIEDGSAELPGRTQVEVSGRLALGDETSFAGSLLVASRQPSGLSQWLTGEVGPEIRALNRAGFSADVNLTPDTQIFENLQVVAGDAVLDGAVSRQSQGAGIPQLDLDLSGNVIDLSALRALAGLMVGENIDGGLNQHRIHATLRAGTVNAFDLSAEVVDTDFTYQSGAVTVDRLEIGDLAGAAITLSGQAQTGRTLPTGSGRVTFAADDISGFVATLEQRFGEHPVLDRLAENAAWYQNTDLEADIAFGQDGTGVSAVFSGSANDSKISGSWRRDALMGPGGMSGQIQLSNPDAAIVFGQAGFAPLPIPAPAGAQVSLTLERSEATGPVSLGLRAASGETRLSVSGEAGLDTENFLGGRYAVSLTSPDLEPYLAMNAFAVPGTAFGVPLSAKATLDISAQQYALSAIEGELDGNAVRGRLALARGEPVAHLEGALSFDSFDLGWLMEAVYGPNFTLGPEGLPDTSFGSAYFGTAEADIDIQAASFDAGLMEPVTGMSGTVDFRGGGLSMTGLSGRFLGGTLSGDLQIGNAGGDGYFQAQVNLADAALPETLWQSNGAPVVSGRFDLGLVVETTADTAAGLLEQASGSGMLTLKSPVVSGLDLSVADPLLAWADAQGTEVTNEAIEQEMRSLIFVDGSFEAGDVAVPFSITDGVLQARNVFVDLPEARIYGAMRTDLARRDVDASINVALKLGEESEEGANAGFSIGFSGPLADPDRSLELTEVNNFLALRAVERERARVERLQADILEKQRLRREATLYSFRAEQREIERQQREEAERLRREEEQRRAREAGDAADDQSAIPAPSPDGETAVQGEPPLPADSDWDRLIESIIEGSAEQQGISPPAP
ncbi:UNVERIFIED_ORG: AsmA-like protein [Martelella mediterranea]